MSKNHRLGIFDRQVTKGQSYQSYLLSIDFEGIPSGYVNS